MISRIVYHTREGKSRNFFIRFAIIESTKNIKHYNTCDAIKQPLDTACKGSFA